MQTASRATSQLMPVNCKLSYLIICNPEMRQFTLPHFLFPLISHGPWKHDMIAMIPRLVSNTPMHKFQNHRLTKAFLWCLTAVILLHFKPATVQAGNEKPNFVFILSEDNSKHYLRLYGAELGSNTRHRILSPRRVGF
jgi:hypothetical protein